MNRELVFTSCNVYRSATVDNWISQSDQDTNPHGICTSALDTLRMVCLRIILFFDHVVALEVALCQTCNVSCLTWLSNSPVSANSWCFLGKTCCPIDIQYTPVAIV